MSTEIVSETVKAPKTEQTPKTSKREAMFKATELLTIFLRGPFAGCRKDILQAILVRDGNKHAGINPRMQEEVGDLIQQFSSLLNEMVGICKTLTDPDVRGTQYPNTFDSRLVGESPSDLLLGLSNLRLNSGDYVRALKAQFPPPRG